MLPRRLPTKATPNPISSPLMSSSVSGRRSLNLPITHQQPFRASTAQTVEPESFVSETSPRETLPVAPRPVSFLPSPPGNSGSRWQQAQHDAQETLPSAPFDGYIPLQPPNVMPIPTTSVSQTPEPSAFPMRSRQLAPGGVGGFASTPSPHHGSRSDHFRHNTVDYSHKFDPKFSTHSGSSSPPYEPAGISEGVHAGIWTTYNKVSQEFDEKRLKKWNEDLDVLLIFVSLVVKTDRCSY